MVVSNRGNNYCLKLLVDGNESLKMMKSHLLLIAPDKNTVQREGGRRWINEWGSTRHCTSKDPLLCLHQAACASTHQRYPRESEIEYSESNDHRTGTARTEVSSYRRPHVYSSRHQTMLGMSIRQSIRRSSINYSTAGRCERSGTTRPPRRSRWFGSLARPARFRTIFYSTFPLRGLGVDEEMFSRRRPCCGLETRRTLNFRVRTCIVLCPGYLRFSFADVTISPKTYYGTLCFYSIWCLRRISEVRPRFVDSTVQRTRPSSSEKPNIPQASVAWESQRSLRGPHTRMLPMLL